MAQQPPLPSSSRPAPYTNQEITIRPLTTLQDFLSLRGLRNAAFGPNELFDLCWPVMNQENAKTTSSPNAPQPTPPNPQEIPSAPSSAAAEEHSAEAIEAAELQLKEALSNHRQVWTGVFSHDEAEKLLAVAHWYFLDDPSIPHNPHGPRPGGGYWPPGTNVPLAEAHFGEFRRRKEVIMAGKSYAYMCLLIVAPEAQRRGLGERLLRLGLEEVDKRGWETWIEATPAGLGLYERQGWRVVDWVETDLGLWGGKGVARDALCVRPANKTVVRS